MQKFIFSMTLGLLLSGETIGQIDAKTLLGQWEFEQLVTESSHSIDTFTNIKISNIIFYPDSTLKYDNNLGIWKQDGNKLYISNLELSFGGITYKIESLTQESMILNSNWTTAQNNSFKYFFTKVDCINDTSIIQNLVFFRPRKVDATITLFFESTYKILDINKNVILLGEGKIINVGHLPKGLYFVQVREHLGEFIKK